MTLGSKGEHEHAVILFDPGIREQNTYYPQFYDSKRAHFSMNCHHLSLIFSSLIHAVRTQDGRAGVKERGGDNYQLILHNRRI